MFSVGDARRYPGFFTRTWTPPPGGTSPHPSRSQGSRSAAFAHETPPPLTPRLATPISVRGLSASDPVSQLYNARVRENDAQASRALVGISREEPDISPHVSTLDAPCSSWCNKTHAGRNGWEDMSPEERMAYTTRLEEDLGHMQSTLDQAYHLRDHYKEEAARLHKELMQKKRTLERLECDHHNCENIISRYQRQEAELRQQLDIVEGEVERLKALLQSGEERQYNSMLGTEGELWQKQREVLNLQEERRKLEEQINSLKTELSMMHPTSVTRDIAVKQPQRSFLTEEGTEEEEIGQAHNVMQLLRNELQDLRQQLHGARSEQERTLGEVINQRNALQGVNTSLREELEGLKKMCSSQNMTINEMNEALSRRACLTHQEHQALVKRCEELFNELQQLQIRDTDSINRTIEMEKQIIQQNLFTLRIEGDEKDSLLRKAHADLAKMRDHIKKLETELDAARSDKANLEQEFSTTRIQLQYIEQNNRNSDNLKEELHLTIQSQLSTIQQLQAKIEKLEHQVADISAAEMPQRTPKSSSREGRTHTQLLSSPAQVTRQMEETVSDQCVGQQDPHLSGQQYPSPEDINHMYDQLASARATIDQMSADRNTQAARVAELTAAVARLEENVDSPGRVVEALTTELREAQERLRDAEEEASRLSERLRDAEQRCESAAAVRSAGVGLEQQLSSALAALEQLAEEREAVATRCAELEDRVAELSHDRDEARSSAALREAEANGLREECNMKAHLVSNALAALDQVAQQHAITETVYDEQSSNLQLMFEALQEQFVVTKKGFEVQWERRVEASTAELMSARRSAQRAGEARKRAEENAAYCMRELERVHADLLKQQRDYRALERLLRSSGRLSTSRLDGDDDDNGTNCSGVRSFCRDTEGVELAQFLQISSLQVDLMLSRRNCHQLEARQEELQTALERSELQLASLPPSAEESYAELRRVRGQLESLQDEHRRLEERFETLKRERAEDVEQLQEQNERLVQQLREKRDKLASLTRQMRESELAAKQQTEELSDAFNLLEGQMRALREEVGIGQSESRQQGRARRPQRAKENTDVETMMLQSRIKFLEKTLKQKEEEMHCLQEELERNETQLDQFEDQMTLVTQRLETTSRKSTHLEQTVHELKRTNEELRGELDILKTRVLQRDERLSSHRAVSVGATHRDARGSSPAPTPSQSEEAEHATPTTAATPRGSRRLQGQRTPPAPASMSPTSGRRPAAKRARSIRGRT